MNELKIILLIFIFIILLCLCNNYEYFGRRRRARRAKRRARKAGRKAKYLSDDKKMEITFQNPAYKQCQHDLNTLLDKFPNNTLQTTLGINTEGLTFQEDTNKIDYDTYGYNAKPQYPTLYTDHTNADIESNKVSTDVSEKIQVFADIGLIGNKNDKICAVESN